MKATIRKLQHLLYRIDQAKQEIELAEDYASNLDDLPPRSFHGPLNDSRERLLVAEITVNRLIQKLNQDKVKR